MSSSSSGTAAEYTINGVKVHFPCKAYPSQLTMMDKIIKGIERKQNSLLESPTGSGKSLALLCASLAWLMAEKDKIRAHQLYTQRSYMEMEDEMSQCCSDHDTLVIEENVVKEESVVKEAKVDDLVHVSTPAVSKAKEDSTEEEACANAEDTCTPQKPTQEAKNAELIKEEAHMQDADTSTCTQSSDDVDFQVPKKRIRTPGNQPTSNAKRQRHSEDCPDDLDDLNNSVCKKPPEWTMEFTKQGKEGSCCNDGVKENIKDVVKENIKDVENGIKKDCKEESNIFYDQQMSNELPPQIFFGTRTHKQITQIVRELNKTKYNASKMCILASREHACIHPEVSQSKNKQEDCRKCVEGKEGKSCVFHERLNMISNHECLERHGLNKTWDIEDLVSLGEKIKVCPYYVTREIMKDADIIFCPYNYLIDPIIRSQMSIKLYDQIVILDEAHNIEDSCRAAASWSVTTQQLEDAIADIDYFLTYNIFPEQHRALHSVCANLRRWIVDNSTQLLNSEYEKSSKVWDGKDMLNALAELAFTPTTMPILAKHLKKVTTTEDVPPREQLFRKENRKIKATTKSLFEGLFMVLSFLLKKNYKFSDDYRMVVIKKADVFTPATLPGGWRRKGVVQKKWVLSLNFWCLSPAVAFSDIGLQSRSVILTSGTLSPMSTFSSELGTNFPIQLEANHVVGKSQVWVSTLSVGPSGSALNATYRYAETFSFQDELGNAIHNVCQVVPHGVLCFLPSYSMLDKLMKRWKTTGLWGRLMRLKNTFYEPRRGDKADFNDMMDEFYAAIKASEEEDDSESGNINGGALFLAVCRGKVSEGLDFADNNARAVITVGIPFPNIKDKQVELKRKYNNLYCGAKGLLSGSEWYEIQAYRALNQALGRCIRHKNDWGAILLIDERFGKSPKYRNGLSKWIRSKVVHHDNFQNVVMSLKQFAAARLENPIPTATQCTTPRRTSCSTPCRTPGTTMDESKPNLESPDLSLSDPHSPDQTPGKPTNFTEQSPHLSPPMHDHDGPRFTKGPLSVPTFPKGEQITQKVTSVHVTGQPSSLVKVPTSVAGDVLVPKTLHFTTLNNILIPGSASNLQQNDNHSGVATPVVLRLVSSNFPVVSAAGLSAVQGNVTGQQIELGTPVALVRSEASLVRPASLTDGGRSTGLRTGFQNSRAEEIGAANIRPLFVEGRKSTSKLQGAHGDTEGSRVGNPGGQKVLQRPLFCSNENAARKQGSFVLDKTFEGKAEGDARTNHKSEKTLSGETVTPPGFNTNTVLNGDLNELKTTEDSPESPLLFVTPPSSFGNSDDVVEINQGTRVNNGNTMDNAGITEARERFETRDDKDTEGQDKLMEVEKMECEGKQGVPCMTSKSPVACLKTSEESAVGNRKKDLLDIVDCELQDKNAANAFKWNISCSRCGATFLSGNSGDVKPEEKDIPFESFLGRILGSLFFFNNNKKKKDRTVNTVCCTCDFSQVRGCSSAIKCSEGMQDKQEVKLNSIYVEEESRCYVPLTCAHCDNSRKPRNRANVMGARAVNCGKEIRGGSSSVWFSRDKVQLDTSAMELSS